MSRKHVEKLRAAGGIAIGKWGHHVGSYTPGSCIVNQSSFSTYHFESESIHHKFSDIYNKINAVLVLHQENIAPQKKTIGH